MGVIGCLDQPYGGLRLLMQGPYKGPHLATSLGLLQRQEGLDSKGTIFSTTFLFGMFWDCHSSCLDNWSEQTGIAPPWKWLSTVTMATSSLGSLRRWSVCMFVSAPSQAVAFWATTGAVWQAPSDHSLFE